MKRSLIGAGLLLAGLSCAPQPEVGVDAVFIDRRPPRDRIEVVGVAPGRGMVWRRGHWGWMGGDYSWVPGSWIAVAPSHRSWAPGRWVHTRRGWYFVEGHWR